MKLGQKVRFELFHDDRCPDVQAIRCDTTGTIVAIYYNHGWFSVEYGNKQRTSFKFSDIDRTVKLIG